jgi:multicomponent Na+:H+ antiporter subunit B
MTGPESYIFRTVIRFAFFLINVFAIYLLLRGHNLPGGGFIGGLAAAISLVLLSLALGIRELHRIMRLDPVRLAAAGLLLATVSSAGPIFIGRPFLEQFTFHLEQVPVLGVVHVGTPLLFDLGVFLVVVGVTCKIIFVLTKSTQGLRALVHAEELRYSSLLEAPVEEEPVDELEPEPPSKGVDHAS